MGQKKNSKGQVPQEHLTNADDLLKKMEVDRKKDIVKDKFFPALVKATISVDEAKMLLGSISALMMEKVMGAMRERKFSEISEDLFKVLTEGGEREEEIRALLSVFEKENLFVTRELIEGMKAAIEQMILDDMQGRNLESLKADWNRYLN